MRSLLIILLLASCSQKADVQVIDRCEYLTFYTNGTITAVTHKGNCDNPIHQYEEPADTTIFNFAHGR